MNEYMHDDPRLAIEVSDLTNKIDVAINNDIERIKTGGELDEIIAGTMRKDWLDYYTDEFTEPENASNLINPAMDSYAIVQEIIESADKKIRKVMEAEYYGN